jgi:hypothetical protein
MPAYNSEREIEPDFGPSINAHSSERGAELGRTRLTGCLLYPVVILLIFARTDNHLLSADQEMGCVITNI